MQSCVCLLPRSVRMRVFVQFKNSSLGKFFVLEHLTFLLNIRVWVLQFSPKEVS